MTSPILVGSVSSLSWYVVLVPPLVGALAIRLDAVFIGPYWTFMEVLPGMGGVDIDYWYERPTLRFAIVRRYAYAVAVGVVATLWRRDLGLEGAALLGLLLAGLLLWPIVFHGLPLGVLRSDWQLIPLYASVVVSFVTAAVIGNLAVEYVRAQSDGDAMGWLQDHLLDAAFFGGLALIANAVFSGSAQSLREKKRRREEAGEEHDEDDL